MSLVLTVLVLGGRIWSPVDLISPDVLTLRGRMLFLCKGMADTEVEARLGLKSARLCGIWGTEATNIVMYQVGQRHMLFVAYSRDWKRDTWVLSSAALQAHQDGHSEKRE